MTPATAAPPRPSRPDLDERAETFLEWIELHSTWITIALVVLALIVGGIWFMRTAHRKQAENASAALSDAEGSISAGNLALAQTQLQSLLNRYGSTPAGKEAHLLLAQVYYDKGQFQQGVEQLKPLTTADDKFRSSTALNLVGAGYEEMGKYQDAADAYQQAADRAPSTTERSMFRANAARALGLAGKFAEAKKIWAELAAEPNGPVAAEARVRLGELEAKTS